MCEDIFDDDFEDAMDSTNDDFQEDLAEESGEDWYVEKNNIVDEHGDNTFSTNRDDCEFFDRDEIFIVGSMIAGNAYEEAVEKKNRQDLLRIKKKQK